MGRGRPVAWLSLDEGDNDPVGFLTYLITALQTIAANVGAGTLRAFQSPQPPSIQSALTTLLNEIAAIPRSFILVLDYYHVIDASGSIGWNNVFPNADYSDTVCNVTTQASLKTHHETFIAHNSLDRTPDAGAGAVRAGRGRGQRV